jgi:integrase
MTSEVGAAAAVIDIPANSLGSSDRREDNVRETRPVRTSPRGADDVPRESAHHGARRSALMELHVERSSAYAASMSTLSQPAPNPSPPTQAQAATIVMEASNDPGWGMFVWLALTVDARHGELCVLRWDDVDFDTDVLTIRSSMRRIVLDVQTITLLRAYLAHCAAQAVMLGIERRPDGYVFSLSPDGGTAPGPDMITERYARMCVDLGWNMHLDQLPHYSATELIAAGVDVRTFNWRLQRGLSRVQRRPRA